MRLRADSIHLISLKYTLSSMHLIVLKCTLSSITKAMVSLKLPQERCTLSASSTSHIKPLSFFNHSSILHSLSALLFEIWPHCVWYKNNTTLEHLKHQIKPSWPAPLMTWQLLLLLLHAFQVLTVSWRSKTYRKVTMHECEVSTCLAYY